jgi:hypothetical protein
MPHQVREWIYDLLDRLISWLIDVAVMIEPEKPRQQELDYHVSALPDEILAIVRVSWYVDGKPDEVDEMVLMEDGQNGYDAFAAVVSSALQRGANVSIRSGYAAKDLGIMQ